MKKYNELGIKAFSPSKKLDAFIAAYWLIQNHTGDTIHFPVLPDGCDNIIFNFDDIKNPTAEGIVGYVRNVPITKGVGLFGIKFKPGMLSFLLGIDMKDASGSTIDLASANKIVFNTLQMKVYSDYQNDQEIISGMDKKLQELFSKITLDEKLLRIIGDISTDPNDASIQKLTAQHDISIRAMGRLFDRHIGLSPKRFARIVRFQNAHRHISQNGLKNLLATALSSGYFDQSHFNREYKALTGTNPTSETMSVLYNTQVSQIATMDA